MLVRFAPLVVLVLFFLVGALGRSLVHRRRHGTFGFAVTWREAPFVASIPVAFLAQALVAAVRPESLAPWTLPLPEPAQVAGLAIIVSATALMAVAQLDLGASWRIGIERGARPGLVTGGYYRVCRNPIFGFMLLGLVGLTLLLPTAFSLALTALAYAATRAQVATEERWLAETYGEPYRAYASRVGRFTPWIGRLHR